MQGEGAGVEGGSLCCSLWRVRGGWLKADYLLALCKAEKIVHMCLPKQKGNTKSKKKADWGYRFQSWSRGRGARNVKTGPARATF